MKCCIIRRVPFKIPGIKSRMLWGHIIAENEGLALVLVPKPEHSQPHSLFIAAENIAERVFEPVTPHRFDLETMHVKQAGEALRILGESFREAEWLRNLPDFDEFP